MMSTSVSASDGMFSGFETEKTREVSDVRYSSDDLHRLIEYGKLRFEFKKHRPAKESYEFMEVTTTSAGQLAGLLGERANELDSISVSGPIDESDFETMWRASFDGRLSSINLEGAQVKDGIVPESAFWHAEQIDIENGKVYLIQLRNIILPEGVSKIGDEAFAYVAKLENINLPSTLQEIGKVCFSDCYNLSVGPLTLPEGMESVSERYFMNCRSLEEIRLPESIRNIENEAFSGSKITAVNFPVNIEYNI